MNTEKLEHHAKSTYRWIKKVQRRAKDSGNLMGYCARASFRLAAQLRRAGYNAKVKVGSIYDGMAVHAWVEVNGYIVDVTCNQFKGPNILIAPKQKAIEIGNNFHEQNPYAPGGRPITFTSILKNPRRTAQRFNRKGWCDSFAIYPEDLK